MEESVSFCVEYRDVARSLLSLCVLFSLFILLTITFYFVKYKRNGRDSQIAARNPTIISNQFLRELWEWLTFPIFQSLLFCNLSPNHITTISLLIALLSGITFAFGNISTAGWLLVFSGMFDTLDGRVARHKKIDSKAGAFFDSVVDRYSDYFILAGIISYFSIFDSSVGREDSNAYLSLLALLSLLGSHLISYSKERGANLGVTDERGIMQRADRMMILGITAIFDPLIYFLLRFFHGEQFPLMNHYYGLGIGLLLIGVFSNLTAIRRIRRIMRALA